MANYFFNLVVFDNGSKGKILSLSDIKLLCFCVSKSAMPLKCPLFGS